MAIVGAFLWHKKENLVGYMIIDNKTLETKQEPHFFKFSPLTLNKKIKGFFKALHKFAAKREKVIIEYKTYMKSPMHKPHSKTKTVDEQFMNIMDQYKVNKKSRRKLRSLLSGKPLKKFKAATKDVLYKRKRGQAKLVYLWEVALHATPAKVDGLVRRIQRRA